MTHQLKVLNAKGDTTLTWEVDNEVEVQKAQEQFEEMIQTGFHLAYRKESLTAQEAEQITEFDKTAPVIVMFPSISGG